MTRRAGTLAVSLPARAIQPGQLGRLLDEVVHQLRRRVVHLDVEVLNAARQVVVEPHRRDGDEETERGLDERFRDTGRDGADAARARGRDADERVDDADDRAEQADERGRRADGRQGGDALLEVVRGQRRGALNRATNRVEPLAGVALARGRRALPARPGTLGFAWNCVPSYARPPGGRCTCTACSSGPRCFAGRATPKCRNNRRGPAK